MIELPSEPASWTTVIVRVTEAEADLIADRLWRHGPAAIEARDDEAGTLLLAGFAEPATARAAAESMAATGAEVRVETVTDDGLDGWRPYAKVTRAGQFLLHPIWLPEPDAHPGDLVLHLDPGRTFGSGSHPTSRLCLEALSARVRPGDAVLDVGCGSGILAVGAARLGAIRVVAIDIDPDSPAVTEANAARNGVGPIIEVSMRTLAATVATEAPFPVVVANLLSPVIIDLAPDLVAATAPSGHLIVSGLLADRWQAAVGALAGCAVIDQHEQDGWVAVTLTAPGAPPA